MRSSGGRACSTRRCSPAFPASCPSCGWPTTNAAATGACTSGTDLSSRRTTPERCGGYSRWYRNPARSITPYCLACVVTPGWSGRRRCPAPRRTRPPGGAWPGFHDRRLMTGQADILIAGAGPAGLALALQARAHGAAVRIIDRRPEAARPSRALILHARTLEVLRPLGVTQALLARSDTAPAADLQLGSRLVRITLGGLALPDTAFPHLTLVRQMDVERVLARALADRGIEVERGTELAAVRDEPGGARALLRTPAGSEQARFGFAVGCD